MSWITTLISYEYPNGVHLNFSHSITPSAISHRTGDTFIGSKGAATLDHDRELVYYDARNQQSLYRHTAHVSRTATPPHGML